MRLPIRTTDRARPRGRHRVSIRVFAGQEGVSTAGTSARKLYVTRVALAQGPKAFLRGDPLQPRIGDRVGVGPVDDDVRRCSGRVVRGPGPGDHVARTGAALLEEMVLTSLVPQ